MSMHRWKTRKRIRTMRKKDQNEDEKKDEAEVSESLFPIIWATTD